MTPSKRTPPVKPIVVLIVCLCVVAMMFAGSVFIGTLVVESERAQTSAPADGSP